MTKFLPLPSSKLRASLPPERIPFETSDSIPRNGKRHVPQQRALQALDFIAPDRDTPSR